MVRFHGSSNSLVQTAVEGIVAAAAPPSTCSLNSGDESWVMMCGILVLCMIPSLALFEAGLLRRKNSLHVIAEIFIGTGILSVMWFIFGYSLTFGPDHYGIIGDFSYIFFFNVDIQSCGPQSDKIPHAVFAFFQMMFAVIAPLLVTGAFAERLKMGPFIIFIILWETLIYYPLAHQIWADGYLGQLNTLDFAGGIVIHTTAGTSSIIMALIFGKRHGFDKHHGEPAPHNIMVAVIGASLLWMGFFGFNAASALGSGYIATNAIICTQISSSISTIVWFVLSYMLNRKVSIVALLNGALSGLAGITAPAGYVTIQVSLLNGFLCGLTSFFSVLLLKHFLKIDDALDVTSIHGITGLVGAVLNGFFASAKLNPEGADGVFYGNPKQLGIQLLAILVTIVYTGIVTVLICIFFKRFILATDEQQIKGLDDLEIQEKTPYEMEDPEELEYKKRQEEAAAADEQESVRVLTEATPLLQRVPQMTINQPIEDHF